MVFKRFYPLNDIFIVWIICNNKQLKQNKYNDENILYKIEQKKCFYF